MEITKSVWYIDGKIHRPVNEGHAVEFSNGDYEDWVDGNILLSVVNGTTRHYTVVESGVSVYNRTDGPAIENSTGMNEWYVNGFRHRVDGPAIECPYGDKKWYFEGKLHRIGGPAIELANGEKEWYVNGKLHRVDGPSIENKKWF